MNFSTALAATSATCIGLAATIGQILALRELLTVFSGSELAVAVVLASWLFWTAVGSLTGGKISQLQPRNLALFGYLQSLSGLVLIATIFLMRAARALVHAGAGEVVTLGQMLEISFLTLAPFCLMSGALFSLATSLLAAPMSRWARSPGLVYCLEGLGAGIGGLLFTLVLIQHFKDTQIAGQVASCLCVSGLLITLQRSRRRWLHGSVFVLVICCLAIYQYRTPTLDKVSRQWQWSGFQLIDSQETVFGHIVVVARENQLSFFENGIWNFTVPDQMTAEETVHYALLQHSAPQNVLLIGGGVSEALTQLLQHPSVVQVDYVELDPRLIQMGETHLPADVTRALQDPRVTVHYEDGRRFLARTSHRYDVILLNLPEPFTAQLNRYYTQEFFRLAASKMHNGGVFSFTASAAETALGPIQARYLKLLQRTASVVFAEVIIFPGQTAHFFCSNSSGILINQPEILVERLRQRHLEPLYVQDHYMFWDLSPLRQQSFMAMVSQAHESGMNSDVNFRAYAYNLLLWGTQYSPLIADVFTTLSERTIWIGILLICLLTALLSVVRRPNPKDAHLPALRLLYAVAVFGLTEISLEILIVLAFQVFFGYVYYKIGLLLALFMVGLALGSVTMTYYPKTKSTAIKALSCLQCVLACFCLGLAVVVILFHNRAVPAHDLFAYREAFSFMSLAAGFIGGTHFPLASQLLLQQKAQVGRTAGLIYAADLMGSFLGCLLVGLLLVPLVGIVQTLVILALVNMTAMAVFLGGSIGTTH